MFILTGRIFRLFYRFRLRLLIVALLILLPRLGDLAIPFFAGRVFDALANDATPHQINVLIVQAACFWVLHGNILPFVCDWFECRYFGIPARQHISQYGLGSMLEGPAMENRQQLATMHQAVLEDGEAKLMGFMESIIRTAIPIGLMSLCAMVMILWWIPLLGCILLAGGCIDLLITIYANGKLKDRFARVQQLTFQRQRQHREIFNNILPILQKGTGRSVYEDYSARYGELSAVAIDTQTRFLRFRLSRDVILNLTNCLTWIVGAWCVYTDVYTIGVFLMVLGWSARATELFGLVTLLHKRWLDTTPAIRSFFAAIDEPHALLHDEPSALAGRTEKARLAAVRW